MGSAASSKTFSTNEIPDLTGKIAVVTGGNIGIGFAICQALASKGAVIYVASRNVERVNQAVKTLKEQSGNSNIHGEIVDLASMGSIEAFAASMSSKVDHIDILINNAGLFVPPFGKTREGFETTLGVNGVGTIFLTNQLLPLIIRSKEARIIMVTSAAFNRTFRSSFRRAVLEKDIGGEQLKAEDVNLDIYSLSKLFRSMFATELQRRLEEQGIHHVFVASAHPGIVNSDAFNKSNRELFFIRFIETVGACARINADVGALSSLFLATAPLSEVRPFKGQSIFEGPKINLIEVTHQDYTAENCRKVYEEMHAIVEKKGFRWKELN